MTTENPGYLALRDSEDVGDLVLSHLSSEGVYSACIFLGEDGHAVADPDGWLVPTLCDHVGCVVFGRTEKEMVWTNAQANVAFVKNEKFSRDRSVVQFPGDAMSPSVGVAPSPRPYPAVSIPASSSCPQPTVISLFDLRPESLGNRSSDWCHTT